MENINIMSARKRELVGIIGTGEYAIALGRRLLDHNYDLIYGSRNPDILYLRERLGGELNNDRVFHVTSISNAWSRAHRLVFFCVSAYDTVYDRLAAEITQSIVRCRSNTTTTTSAPGKKILIEISNLLDNQTIKSQSSNAERLQQLFNEKLEKSNVQNYRVSVVKGFNLVSARSISSNMDEYYDRQTLTNNFAQAIPIAGDDMQAKQAVIEMCERIGFKAYDVGALRQALRLEVANRTTFSDWLCPSVFCALFYAFNVVWMLANAFFFPRGDKMVPFDKYVSSLSILTIVNKTTGFTSLKLLAYVYLPNVIASLYQLARGSKQTRFPRWLNAWLISRRQLGLWSFLFASIHFLSGLSVVNPSYVNSWYQKSSVANTTTTTFPKMTINGELNVLTGMTAYILFILLSLSSINSIASSLNLSEWRLVQSRMGLGLLAMSLVHDLVMHIRLLNERREKEYSLTFLLTRTKFYSIFLPLFVLVARALLAYFPPLSVRLQKIRNGVNPRHLAARNKVINRII